MIIKGLTWDFAIVTPWLRTEGGSWGSARFTRISENTSAMFGSKPRSKSIRNFIVPSLALNDRMSKACSTCGVSIVGIERPHVEHAFDPRHRFFDWRCNRAFNRKRVRSDIVRGNYDLDRKSTRLNSSHLVISYAVFCLKK